MTAPPTKQNVKTNTPQMPLSRSGLMVTNSYTSNDFVSLLVAFTVLILVATPTFASPLPLSARAAHKLKALLIKDTLKRKSIKAHCRGKLLKDKRSFCDAEDRGRGDGLTNYRETKLGTNRLSKDSDGDFLNDRAELIKFLTDPRKADTDGDGVFDGNEDSDGDGIANEDEDDKPNQGPTAEDADDLVNRTPGECAPPNYDTNGDTSKFGIPSGLHGNISTGQAKYSQRCAPCHVGIDQGANYTFPQLKLAINSAPMFITNLTNQEVANIVAYLNRTQTGGSGDCSTPAPTPTPLSPGDPTPTPTIMPTATPVPEGWSCTCLGANYDSSCNTTGFGIPTPLSGNIDAGLSYFALTCSGCHSLRGQGFTYPALQAAVTGPLMNINSVPAQKFADLVAYLNSQAVIKTCTGPTPTPAPTPNSVQRGSAIFTSSCALSGCHTINSQGRPREMDRHPSLSTIHQALRSGPDEMPKFLGLTLGASAPPYSEAETNLHDYLASLP